MNELFPIFVKLEQVQTLLVGAGVVGLEKLKAILSNSPQANVHVVAIDIDAAFHDFVSNYVQVRVSNRPFAESDSIGVDIIILATNNAELNQQIRALATQQHILLNVADKPSLCDFYLGAVVQKGNLKVGISTNGKSPTMAKRLKEFMQDLLPEEIDESLSLLSAYRDTLKGDLTHKINVLNAHTKEILIQNTNDRADN